MAPGLEKTCLFTTLLILMRKIGSVSRGNKPGNIFHNVCKVFLGCGNIFFLSLSLACVFFNLAFQIEEWLEG